MDLALALLEEDAGAEVALAVARQLVMFVRRPGGQTQFSVQLSAGIAEREPIRDAQQWIAEHPADDLSVEALASRVHMSPRNFARLFQQEMGKTPARHIEDLRLEGARRQLEMTALTLEEVADASGFASAETLRRVFRRRLGVTPGQYRASFGRHCVH